MNTLQKFKHLVWFRNDLRVYDNPSLFRAADAGGGVLAVYIICKSMIVNHRVAPARLDFIRRQLLDLQKTLSTVNIPLLVFSVDAVNKIPSRLEKLIAEYGVEQLHFNAEYPLDELNRDKNVAQALRAKGVVVSRSHDRVLIPPGMIRNQKGEPYRVFSAFKKNWLNQVRALPLQPFGKPAAQPKHNLVLQTTEQISKLFSRFTLRDLQDCWPAGEVEARRRLQDFIQTCVEDYHEARDVPHLDGTSQLSPYLALGAISPKQCILAVLQVNNGELDSGGQGAASWVNEFIWRDFYQHLVVDFPEVCKGFAMQRHTEAFPWRHDQDLFQRWCAGQTGVPIVDAAMRQLIEMGWMHNRLRMVVAMYLTKNLQIDWRWGESYFMDQLIDGDFGANNGGWQWCASTGVDAAPYFRIFNPIAQSQRFDADGLFIKRYIPALSSLGAKHIHCPPKEAGYFEPIVDLKTSRADTIAIFAALHK